MTFRAFIYTIPAASKREKLPPHRLVSIVDPAQCSCLPFFWIRQERVQEYSRVNVWAALSSPVNWAPTLQVLRKRNP